MPTVGQTLTRSTGSWTQNPTSFATRWLRGSTAISGQTASTYVVATADLGSTLRAEVIASNSAGASSPALSSPTTAVTNPPNPPGTGNTYLFANGASAPIYGWHTHPASLYVASQNKTWCVWEAGPNAPRQVWCRVFNHATGLWTNSVIVGNSLSADDHGAPCIGGPDAQGYMYAFYGSHGSVQMVSRTTNPNDQSAWTRLPNPPGFWSYCKPVISGNKMYVFGRVAGIGQTHQVPSGWMRATISSGGVLTWDVVPKEFHAIESQRRNYFAYHTVVGTKVYFAGTVRNHTTTNNGYSLHVWVFDMADETFKNAQETFSQSAHSVVSLSDWNTHTKLIGVAPGAAPIGGGFWPSGLEFDGSGNLHVVFAYPSFAEKRIMTLANGATSWTAAATGPPVWTEAVHRIADGRLRGLVSIGTGWHLSTRASNGTWSTVGTPMFTRERDVPNGGAIIVMPVHNGGAQARVYIVERGGGVASGGSGNGYLWNGTLRGYLWADAGLIRAPTG